MLSAPEKVEKFVAGVGVSPPFVCVFVCVFVYFPHNI